MSTVDFNLTAEVRSDLGKGASRRLRREGKVPAVIYGGDKAAESITLDHDNLYHHLENEAFYSHILSLDVAGTTQSVVLKDLQRHPAKDVITHADFLRVKANEKIRMHVPLHFINEEQAPGVKAGGVVTHNRTEVEIQCLPKNLPEYLAVDMAAGEIDSIYHLTDIILPAGVELIDLLHGEEHNIPVAAIHKTRASMEAEASSEGEGE